jgi:hypothetical protein
MENQPPQEAIVFENEKKEISETRNLIKPKLYINSHWMIPFNIFKFVMFFQYPMLIKKK